MELEPLYKVKSQCHICDTSFETSRVRSSFKKGKSTDADFCIHYRDPDLNPDYYVVMVCPACGYAFTENFTSSMTEPQQSAFYEKVTSRWTWRDYGGQRGWQEALEVYKLSLLCAQIKQESERVISGLLHHIAWLYRYQSDVENEQRFLRYALHSYIKVYEYEGVDVNNARLMYLIGELHRRLGEYDEAVKWFARVVNDMKIMDAAMIAKSREQWRIVSEQVRELKGESRTGEVGS